ncbi:hypothetical protein [Pseudoalteromonas denitrificans]|uniref:Uncharacterized protein n=1 Tax=Pseudoalteromonas denitrificans DSM 6059 TaxID=1123010 RepID=A0A1I1KZY5_9GAMM|nr:hypothetical protein [Pseudoalteromonas denitrificans]SFC66301.1 hypothetical protein SAMN02745724_02229 [Pseudoalteromonas denitrificans DSM 6059]
MNNKKVIFLGLLSLFPQISQADIIKNQQLNSFTIYNWVSQIIFAHILGCSFNFYGFKTHYSFSTNKNQGGRFQEIDNTQVEVSQVMMLTMLDRMVHSSAVIDMQSMRWHIFLYLALMKYINDGFATIEQ